MEVVLAEHRLDLAGFLDAAEDRDDALLADLAGQVKSRVAKRCETDSGLGEGGDGADE